MSWLPTGFGYNIPSLLLIGWACVDVMVLVAVWPLLQNRKEVYEMMAWGRAQMATNSAEEELRKKRSRT